MFFFHTLILIVIDDLPGKLLLCCDFIILWTPCGCPLIYLHAIFNAHLEYVDASTDRQELTLECSLKASTCSKTITTKTTTTAKNNNNNNKNWRNHTRDWTEAKVWSLTPYPPLSSPEHHKYDPKLQQLTIIINKKSTPQTETDFIWLLLIGMSFLPIFGEDDGKKCKNHSLAMEFPLMRTLWWLVIATTGNKTLETMKQKP